MSEYELLLFYSFAADGNLLRVERLTNGEKLKDFLIKYRSAMPIFCMRIKRDDVYMDYTQLQSYKEQRLKDLKIND